MCVALLSARQVLWYTENAPDLQDLMLSQITRPLGVFDDSKKIQPLTRLALSSNAISADGAKQLIDVISPRQGLTLVCKRTLTARQSKPQCRLIVFYVCAGSFQEYPR